MQFIVVVDGKILGQVEISDEADLSGVLSKFPTAILRTPGQMIDDGWR